MTKRYNSFIIIYNMLTVKFVFGDEADNIRKTLMPNKGEQDANCAHFALLDDGSPVGLWRMTVRVIDGEAVGEIIDVVFKDGVESGDKTFFRHAMMFELLEGERLTLRLGEALSDDEFAALKKFGFAPNGGRYEIDSKNINLYYGCGGRK